MKRRKSKHVTRILYLPDWVRLRMNDDLMNQAWFMMEQAEKCNAGRVAIKIGLKNRPWTVTLSVDRKYEKNYGH